MRTNTSGLWPQFLSAHEARVLATYRRPRGASFELHRPALIVVDVVPSFVGPNLPVADAQAAARTACGEAGWAAIPNIARLVHEFREHKDPVIYTVIDEVQVETGGATTLSVDGVSQSGLRSDQVVDDIAPQSDELVIMKTKSSAFFGTPLVSVLVQAEIRSIVLAGCTTSGCVLASAIDGAANGFDVVVAADACFDRVEKLAQASLVTMDAKWARVRSCNDILTRSRALHDSGQGCVG